MSNSQLAPNLDLDPNELLTRVQVAAELGIHKNTLNVWRRRWDLQVYGPRGHRYYRRGDLYDLLKRLGQET